MSKLISSTRPKRYFYAKDVNMSLSFDRLAKMAQEMLGADLEVGDIIICDNANKDKRKMLQRTKMGFIIYYARMDKHEFLELAGKDGKLRTLNQEVI